MRNYNNMYDKAYALNMASVLCFKSSRKNSKCSDTINILHLINNNDDGKISDERILQQFINTLEKIVYYSLQNNKHLELSVYVNVNKNACFINANNKIYHDVENNRYNFQRVKFSSIESCINFLFSIYDLIYTYNEISKKTLYNNSSIKYLINKYYKGS